VDPTPAVHEWTVGLAPDTRLTAAPPTFTPATSASFAFTGSDDRTPLFDIDYECSLDGAAFQSCSSPREVQGLAPGVHTFSVRAKDWTGAVDPTPATHAWTVGSPPNTTIGGGPDSETDSRDASFTFSSNRAGVTFECALDPAEGQEESAFEPCTSPAGYTGLELGEHVLHVRARDAAGTADPSPAEYEWAIGHMTAPVTTIVSGPPVQTAGTSATFEFTAGEEGVSFQCSLDGGPLVFCESPRTYHDLAPGEHVLEVQAWKPHLLASAEPAVHEWTVLDVTDPETTILTGPLATTSLTEAEFTFSSNELDAEFECSLDGGPWESCSSPADFSSLAAGPHELRVRAVDASGNADETPAARGWTVVDVEPPDTDITAQPPATTTSTSASFGFEGSDETTAPGALRYQCRLNSTQQSAWVDDCTSPHTYSGLSTGTHRFEVRARDEAGNPDPTPATHEWTIRPGDTTPPQTTLGSGGPPFTFSSSEASSTFECQVDSGAWAACTSPRSVTGLSAGSHTFRVRARDAAGNVDGSPATRTWTADTTPPNTTLASGGPPFSFTASESNSSFECSLDGGAWTACTAPHAVTGLPAGSHQFRVRARDASGNVDGSPASRSWTVTAPDTTAPNTTLGSGAPPPSTTSTSASFGFSSNESGSSFECSLDGGAWASCTSPRAYGDLAVGPHEFRVRARDAAGNTDGSPAAHSWTIAAPAPGSCTASTVTLGAVADGWILQDSANQNYGTDSVLKVDSKNRSNARGLVRFNLPAIAAGCRLTSAKLRLYAGSYKTGRTLQALTVAAPWTEGALTWNNQPATTGAAATVSSGSGYREWTVTDQVQTMYSTANNGFLIRDAAENANGIDQAFHSREKGTDNPPRLVLTFG
jgi:large repetitive protein